MAGVRDEQDDAVRTSSRASRQRSARTPARHEPRLRVDGTRQPRPPITASHARRSPGLDRDLGAPGEVAGSRRRNRARRATERHRELGRRSGKVRSGHVESEHDAIRRARACRTGHDVRARARSGSTSGVGDARRRSNLALRETRRHAGLSQARRRSVARRRSSQPPTAVDCGVHASPCGQIGSPRCTRNRLATATTHGFSWDGHMRQGMQVAAIWMPCLHARRAEVDRIRPKHTRSGPQTGLARRMCPWGVNHGPAVRAGLRPQAAPPVRPRASP